MNHSAQWPSAGLVLVAPGGVAGPAAPLLAALLGMRLLPDSSAQQEDPALLLEQLAQQPAGWLLPLGLDPGADRPLTGCWADALGAWRQPAVLLLPVAAVGGGADRAYGALLHQASVPLLGLVQLDGPWDAAARSGDGLPWLGWLPLLEVAPGSADEAAALALQLTLLRRWSLSGASSADRGSVVAAADRQA